MKANSIVSAAAVLLIATTPVALADAQAGGDAAAKACKEKAAKEGIAKQDLKAYVQKCKSEQQASAEQGGKKEKAQ